MSNPEPEAEPVSPPTVPDGDLDLGPMTPEQLRRLLCRRYPSTSDVARYLTRDRRAPTIGRVDAGDQSRAAAEDDADGLGVVVNMSIGSFDHADGSDDGENARQSG